MVDSVYDYNLNDGWPPPVEGGPGGDPNTPTPPNTQPPNTQPQPGNSLAYSGKATQALIDAMYGSGYSLKNGQITYTGPGDPFWKQAGQANAAYLNSLADPLAAQDYKKFFQTLYGGSNATQYNLTQAGLSGVLKAAGFNVTGANTQGGISKIQKPGFTGDKGWVRVITGDPIKGGSWDWVEQGDPGPDGTGGSLTDPFGGQFAAPKPGQLPDMPQFHMPTLEDMLTDPGYKFRLGQGTQAMEQSAAARGTLNTGGTLRDLVDYGQSAASQEFGNVWNRNLDAYDRSYRGWQTLFGHGEHQNDLDYSRAYDKWIQDYNHYRNWQNDTFDKQFKTATA